MLRTRVFWLFVAAGFAELAALLALQESTVSRRAIVVLCLCLAWLGSGSQAARWIFVAGNALTLLMTLPLAFATTSGGSGATTMWGNVIVLSGGSAVLLAILLSPAMRHHGRLRSDPSP